MTRPNAETMAQHRTAARRAGGSDGLALRRTMRAISEWFDRGRLGGEPDELVEMTRYTGGRF